MPHATGSIPQEQMSPSHIAEKRLVSHLLMNNDCKTPDETVKRMGAIQAQDLSMALWAVGIRLKDSTEKSVIETFNRGKIIRTHLLRPTWHFVHTDDIRWMSELSAPQIKSSMVARHKQLELDDKSIIKSNDVIVNTFIGKKYVTRNELVSSLEEAGFVMKDNRAAHLLMLAELEGLICSGEIINNKQTYALLDERVPKRDQMSRDEALERLARKYFTSHGPATKADFSWWSGLPARDADRALDILKRDLYFQKDNTNTYWFIEADTVLKNGDRYIYILPAYDEFLISYKDRSASLKTNAGRSVSDNGMFWPAILEEGVVKGIWKRKIINDRVALEMNFFLPPDADIINQVGKGVNLYADFLEKRAEWTLKK